MQFIKYIDSVFTKEECNSVIDFFEQNTDRHHKGLVSAMTKNGDPEVVEKYKKSTDITCFLRKDYNISDIIIHKVIEQLKIYGEHFSLDEYAYPWGLHEKYIIQKYNPGEGFYAWHHDDGNYMFMPSDPNSRMIVWMVYLNSVPDGGTEFLHQNWTADARVGSLLLFPASWTHIHRGQISPDFTKYIMTGWCLYNTRMHPKLREALEEHEKQKQSGKYSGLWN